MHRAVKTSMFVILIILISAVVSPPRADRRDLHCYIQATRVDVRVEVWEEDRRGNKGPLIWKGIVRKGERKRINTRTGGIRVSSTTYIDTNSPLSGDTSRWCDEGSRVGVP